LDRARNPWLSGGSREEKKGSDGALEKIQSRGGETKTALKWQNGSTYQARAKKGKDNIQPQSYACPATGRCGEKNFKRAPKTREEKRTRAQKGKNVTTEGGERETLLEGQRELCIADH